MRKRPPHPRHFRPTLAGRGLAALLLAGATTFAAMSPLRAQQDSVSTWDAAGFRIWGFIPYWSGEAGTSVVQQLNILSDAGTYRHVSDVLYFGGVRPTSTGGLWYHSTATATLSTLQTHAAQHGFRLHMSMFDVAPGGTVDETWTSLVSNPAYRAHFVTQVTDLLQAYDMSGFNFDWERPNTVEKWGNYTQLAREMGEVIGPLGMEISVCDFGFTDSRWDDSPLFDARVYDQLFIMGYHYPAYSDNALNNNHFANGKLALTDQGPEKAFRDEQLTLGIGTWGADGPATVTMRKFVEGEPDLAYDAGSVTGTFTAVNGVEHTGTWTIESRQQVREKTQLALDRQMAGMFSWTLHYDALNELGLHRVMHHYLAFRRGIPDLNLDGRVDATDAHILADQIGSVPGWTGTNTPTRFDRFYLRGNWEVGDHNGNGFVNQADANWLAARFAALGLELPDRLPYTGEFEAFEDSQGLAGRWRSWREANGQLRETGNFTQHPPGHLPWNGSGAGSVHFSSAALTIRNQNAAEAFDSLNTLDRILRAELAQPVDLGQSGVTYFTFLVRQNTGPLLAAQRAAANRTLSLQFLDDSGTGQLGLAFRGAQEELAVQSQPGAAAIAADGFAADTTYLVIGKISTHPTGPNTVQMAWFAPGTEVGDFTRTGFPWMLSAESSAGFNPVLTGLEISSPYQANFTVSNLWVAAASDSFEQWAGYYESLHGAPPGTLSEGADDTDGDGIADLLEYALESRGADPLLPNRSALPQAFFEHETLHLDYPRDAGKPDISVGVRASSDLTHWHQPGEPGAPAGFTDTLLEVNGPVETRRASVPLAVGERVFLRLEVTLDH